MHTIGAFAIITNPQSQVLLCHRTDMDAWNLPGGRVPTGETPWQAVIREVEEETGLVVEVKALVGVYSDPSRADAVFTFRCRIVQGEPSVSAKADQIEWFDSAELPLRTLNRHVERIHDALLNQSAVILKSQG